MKKAFNLLCFLHCDGMNPFLIISKIKLGNLVSSINGDATEGIAIQSWIRNQERNKVNTILYWLLSLFPHLFFNFFIQYTSVRTSHFHFFGFPAVVSQNVTYKSCLACVKRKKYASWVTIRPQWDCCCRGEAEVRIIDFKTTWSEFQMPSQTAPAEAKPRCVYSILKPHVQSFITSP